MYGDRCQLSAKTGGVRVDCMNPRVGSRLIFVRGLDVWVDYCEAHRAAFDKVLGGGGHHG